MAASRKNRNSWEREREREHECNARLRGLALQNSTLSKSHNPLHKKPSSISTNPQISASWNTLSPSLIRPSIRYSAHHTRKKKKSLALFAFRLRESWVVSLCFPNLLSDLHFWFWRFWFLSPLDNINAWVQNIIKENTSLGFKIWSWRVGPAASELKFPFPSQDFCIDDWMCDIWGGFWFVCICVCVCVDEEIEFWISGFRGWVIWRRIGGRRHYSVIIQMGFGSTVGLLHIVVLEREWLICRGIVLSKETSIRYHRFRRYYEPFAC